MISSTTFNAAYGHAATPENELSALRRLDSLARVMDSAFALPLIGTRVGADALLNLLPGAGVIVAKGLSAYLVWEAYRLGVPRAVIARMVGNVVVDLGISVVPVAGWVGDVFFRANLRNVALLRGHLSGKHAGTPRPDDTRRAPITIDGEVVRETRR